MGELLDRLERLRVEARSPDGRIGAEAHGKYHVTVWFAANAYRAYTEWDLGHQLAQLASVVWTRYRRQYTEIMAAFLDEPPPVLDSDDLRFQQRLEEMTVAGRSTSQWINVRSRALVRWEFAISGGAIHTLGEEEFLAELNSAVTDILRDYQSKLRLLTDDIYDIGLPRSAREQRRARLKGAVD
jgi:hypothetical protein